MPSPTCATEVLYRDDHLFHVNPPFTLKEPRLQPGDRLVVQRYFFTLGGQAFERGTVITLIERTFARPFGFLCTAGNWVIQTNDPDLSVWSSIERSYAEGTLAKELFQELSPEKQV